MSEIRFLQQLSFYASLFIIGIFVTACDEVEIVPEPYVPTTAHEAYYLSLKNANLDQVALGQDWLSKSHDALQAPFEIKTPYTELFHLDDRKATALGYQFATERGQKVIVKLEEIDSSNTELFIDLFRLDNDSLQLYSHVASADTSQLLLGFEARQAATYIVRVQPELLRGGNFRLDINIGPSLTFPVANGHNRDIGSFFGDPRDGGRRKHHGVDIFAKRHTPIISPISGRVRFAGEKGKGGRVVWLRDAERDQTLYFAHLESIYVEDDDNILPGDTLGTVGNTGNARTTPPHLHFGIYSDGPVDPYNFIATVADKSEEVRGDITLLGKTVRSKNQLKIKPGDMTVGKFQLMKLLGLTGREYRVELPTGERVLLSHHQVESSSKPITIPNVTESISFEVRSTLTAIPSLPIENSEDVTFHGRNEDFWLVKREDGFEGWAKID